MSTMSNRMHRAEVRSAQRDAEVAQLRADLAGMSASVRELAQKVEVLGSCMLQLTEALAQGEVDG